MSLFYFLDIYDAVSKFNFSLLLHVNSYLEKYENGCQFSLFTSEFLTDVFFFMRGLIFFPFIYKIFH